MSEATTLLNRTPSFLLFGGTSSGASPYAERIPSQYRAFVSRFIESATGSQRIAEPRQAIYDVYERCKEKNWNGEGADPISVTTAMRAGHLVLALPSHFPVPEIFADPTGAIAFEWYRRPKHRFVLSVYGNGSIEFAGLLGVGNEVYGAARMGDGLPEIVRDHLRQLFTD